jgi:hypothetical protein
MVALVVGDAFDKENEICVLYRMEILTNSLPGTTVDSAILNY